MSGAAKRLIHAAPACFVAVAWFFVPLLTHAAVQFTEVMYDLPGADDGREWVELYNSGSTDVDLTDWRFNDGSNHVLNEPPENGSTGSLSVPAGGYLILADDAEVFLSEYDTPVSVIDTVLSLGQQDDRVYTLQLLDEDKAVISEMTYTNDAGAVDGLSLQWSGDSWSVGSPTPGAAATDGTTAQSGSGSSDTNTPTGSSSEGLRPELIPTITVSAGDDRSVIVGADSVFTAQAFGTEREPLEGARFLWSFGDGSMKEGRSVFHHYRYPGDYIVYVDVAVGKFSAADRIIVRAHPAQIELSAATSDYIELSNHAGRELDLSHWLLAAGEREFVLPERTYLAAGAAVRFPRAVTGLFAANADTTRLLYPNGREVQFILPGQEEEESAQAASTAPSAPAPSAPAPSAPATSPKARAQTSAIDAREVQVASASGVAAQRPPGRAAPNDNDAPAPLLPYLLGVLGVVAVGVLAVSLRPGAGEKSLADEFTIIEEN